MIVVTVTFYYRYKQFPFSISFFPLATFLSIYNKSPLSSKTKNPPSSFFFLVLFLLDQVLFLFYKENSPITRTSKGRWPSALMSSDPFDHTIKDFTTVLIFRLCFFAFHELYQIIDRQSEVVTQTMDDASYASLWRDSGLLLLALILFWSLGTLDL